MNLSNTSAISFQTDSAPYSGSNQSRTPVPAVLVLRFTDIKAAAIAIPEGTRLTTLSFTNFSLQPGRGKKDRQLILFHMQQFRNLDTIGNKHIVTDKNLCAI